LLLWAFNALRLKYFTVDAKTEETLPDFKPVKFVAINTAIDISDWQLNKEHFFIQYFIENLFDLCLTEKSI